jgi:hypothetical protein
MHVTGPTFDVTDLKRSGIWRLPKPSDNSIWSWVPWDSEPWIALLARPSKKLLDWKLARVSADIRVLKLLCNKCSAYRKTDTSLVKVEVQILYRYMSRTEQKSWSWISTKPKEKNDCAGEDQQQFNQPTEEPAASTFGIPSLPVFYSFLVFLMK